jgi:predicted secreted acid phosphatase
VLDALRAARASGIEVVFNSNRASANASATIDALTLAGLGPVVHLQNLWLKGDDATGGSGKDARRWAISGKYCVIAMVGDQLGDFTDLFNVPGTTPAQRRAQTNSPKLRMLWGHGWFVLPNPVYGTALKGDIDDVFPKDRRWADPGAQPLVPVPAAAPVPAAVPEPVPTPAPTPPARPNLWRRPPPRP